MTMPKRYYRYGIAPEKGLFDAVHQAADGFVLPAHLVVDQRDSLSMWIGERPFWIDPMTHVWFYDQCDLWNKERDDFKRSYNKIKNRYDSILGALTTPDAKFPLATLLKGPASDAKVANFTQKVIDYQMNTVNEAHLNARIARYFEILRARGIEMPTPPRAGDLGNPSVFPERIVLPYVYFTNQDTPEYEANLRFWEAGGSLPPARVPLCALVSTSSPNLDWERLASDLGSRVKEVVLWFADVDEFTAPVKQLVGIRQAVTTLSKKTYKVHLHSGGPYAMGLGPEGVASVSAGVTYGERRPAELAEGGPVPQRYFIPQLLRCFPVGETRFIVRRMGIDCSNPCCQGLHDAEDLVGKFFAGGPGGEETSWGPTEDTKLHYLYRFKEKMLDVWQGGRDEGVKVLEAMLVGVQSKLPSRHWQHLESWIEAYRSELVD